jgi:hypothetical protein
MDGQGVDTQQDQEFFCVFPADQLWGPLSLCETGHSPTSSADVCVWSFASTPFIPLYKLYWHESYTTV